jgi:hypothetical protein
MPNGAITSEEDTSAASASAARDTMNSRESETLSSRDQAASHRQQIKRSRVSSSRQLPHIKILSSPPNPHPKDSHYTLNHFFSIEKKKSKKKPPINRNSDHRIACIHS